MLKNEQNKQDLAHSVQLSGKKFLFMKYCTHQLMLLWKQFSLQCWHAQNFCNTDKKSISPKFNKKGGVGLSDLVIVIRLHVVIFTRLSLNS